MLSQTFKTMMIAAATLACGLTASAQGFIRDAEIETTLREWTDPILEVAGLQAASAFTCILAC